ncbi:PREDICTED: T-complex protein 11 X-linked protein 2-like [Ceratotherium simum simum]|uniref:T-complex protein 11 X-linked protein 2-like n=1 Tax=Ceratotherium simum simum TaxID=73337 RepID=A0ABM1DMY3_CERSS|nr:PREDICTED: T-complex protein 11 X-linked protein 2-like [Ceratotherium simum simum]
MPKIEETVLQNDSSEAEGEAHKPETPEQSQENKSFCSEDHCPERQPEVLSVTELIETINEVSKLSIAHEIVVNQDFYMEESVLAPNSLEGRFVETMYKAFWDRLKDQLLSTPPDFTCALELLKEVKEILLSLLLPRQNRLRNEIEKALDMDLLKQEAEHGALDVAHLSNCILSLMTLLCAPVRDEAVRKLESITDPVQLLRGIFHVLGLMKMDMVNYTIRSLRPYLKEHSIQYERAKFQELLDKQPNLLDCTTKWLTKAATDITTPSSSSPDSPSSSSMACSPPNWAANNSELPTPTMVLYQGYLNLLLWDPDNEEFPETLLMDRIRLQEMESQLHQLTILASVLLVARSFSGYVLFSSPEFVDKLKCITKALTEEFNSRPEEAMLSVSEQVSQEIHQGLKDRDLTVLSSKNTASLIGQLQNIAKKENCVRSIIDQRIRLFLKCCLVRGMQESLLDFPGGLILIKGELAELGWKFVNLMHHNQQVFTPYYAEILKSIIPPTQA